MKYIMVEIEGKDFPLPVVFPEEITHKDVAVGILKGLRKGRRDPSEVRIRSAGFVALLEGEYSGWRVTEEKSTSLDLGPDEEDEGILNLFLGQGLAGLALDNYSAHLHLQINSLKRRVQEMLESLKGGEKKKS